MSSWARLGRALRPIVCALLLTACAGIDVRFRRTVPASELAARPRDPSSIAVYTISPPHVRYDVVGYVRATQNGWDMESGTALLAQIRVEGARAGCDAIVLDHGYCVESSPGSTFRTWTVSTMEAACIVLH